MATLLAEARFQFSFGSERSSTLKIAGCLFSGPMMPRDREKSRESVQ